MVVNIVNTNPVTNLEFDIAEMMGFADSLSFGLPSVSFGSAYNHDEISDTEMYKGKLIHIDPTVSSSGDPSSLITLPPMCFRPIYSKKEMENSRSTQHRGFQGS